MAFHPTILSGFSRMQWDPGDTRFLVYTLEHSYRWIAGWPHHESFWDPPIFFAAKNAASYSETLITVAPLFWVWRVVGFPFDTSFQLWMITAGVVNFWAAYLFLGRVIGLTRAGASVGAFFFAFCAARINQLGHEQLLCHFFTIGCLYSLGRVLAPPPGQSPAWSRAHVFLGPVWLVAQLYAGVYLGWFLGLALGVAAPIALMVPASRAAITAALRRHAFVLPVAFLVAGVLLLPFVTHYLSARDQVGNRSFSEVSAMLPRWASWTDLGPYSWLYWRRAHSLLIRDLPLEWEQRIGPGPVTFLLAALGLWWQRHRPVVVVSVVAGTLLAAVSMMFVNDQTLWVWVYQRVPGAGAIRTVCRIGLLAWIPFSIGLGTFADRASSGRWGLLMVAALVFAVVEQGLTTPAFDKLRDRRLLQGAAAQLGSDCDGFAYTPIGGGRPAELYNLDAMMVSLWANLPTINGYSGNNPPAWYLGEPRLFSEQRKQQLAEWFEVWRSQHGGLPRHLCWLTPNADDGRHDAVALRAEVPTTMIAGQRHDLELSWRNTGEDTWAPGWGFRIGVEGDSMLWGVNRVATPNYVDPGRETTVRFQVIAPRAPGDYTLQFRPMIEGVGWFGEHSVPVTVRVVTGPRTE